MKTEADVIGFISRREVQQMAPNHQDLSEIHVQADKAYAQDKDGDKTKISKTLIRPSFRGSNTHSASQETTMIQHDDEPARLQAPELATPISQHTQRNITNGIYYGPSTYVRYKFNPATSSTLPQVELYHKFNLATS
ncbi:hypothetical protein CONLIGDRAFT_687904 [Coniochaeta ligniaria NRRL 30616]|uniref:Uncharacterized protein n=1 Tax=Coniochaeta ligniaria NRRL 30616 TaxID=1408157 RepID=A0A1J7I3H4_9PEZI|nr:hypothetical protein CONLIGDRAFT_687904 [Coniochaeta ligniaria NRRL 30616]